MVRIIDKLLESLHILIRTGPRVTCEGLIILSVDDFTTLSGDAPAAPGTGSLLTGDFAFVRDETLTCLNAVPSGSLPTSPEAGDGIAVETTVVDIIGDVRPIHFCIARCKCFL